MTRRESAVMSAFTGIMCGPFSAMHEYVEEVMGRPVWTHEMGSREFAENLKKLAEADFLAIAEAVPDEK